tara:strand:- start:1524 stop:1751 length:228 start_codon:yes stop_codon:yes gene_type:complete
MRDYQSNSGLQDFGVVVFIETNNDAGMPDVWPDPGRRVSKFHQITDFHLFTFKYFNLSFFECQEERGSKAAPHLD